MVKWQGGVWPFVVIMVLHCVAILLFTRGFLLTRTELPFYSNCSDISQSPCFPNSSAGANLNNATDSRQSCWTRPIVDRIVIIVLDALRFDFVAPSDCFEETKLWMDRLKVLQELASQQGSQARVFKAIADPPTTSLQRLKGLTTGGLPTFIDVGNSFGAPAIVEDNLLYQLVQNGKHVVMMGDDTWVQLFPHHFKRSYPYPSFNVKDLDTVDNGCIEHLFPSLYQEDWDVLIAHFLGVDHAGHIFGVDSNPMIEKLEQYNVILERVIEVLRNQSGPGGLHENTLLLVMGDHGQTLNGDHGGGTAEEVETSMFAMSFKKHPTSVPSYLDTSSCELEMDRRKMCGSSIQQLDIAVTISALLGIPFPFGSIGRVNSELYALGAGIWNLEAATMGNYENQSTLEEWLQNYANVLCINSWQVKKYIDVYSASSVVGFSSEDLLHIENIYAQAEENWSDTSEKLPLYKNEGCSTSLPSLKRQIDSYSDFLSGVAELARNKWTEFNLEIMGIGFGIFLVALVFHIVALGKVNKLCGESFSSLGGFEFPSGLIISVFMVAIRACSLLSNSYILAEGKVANFLLATTGILKLRHSVKEKKMLSEAVIFLVLVTSLRLGIELGLSKQAATSLFMNYYPSWILGMGNGHPIWAYLAEVVPVLALLFLGYLLCKSIANSSCWANHHYVIAATILSYILIAVHWTIESELWSLPLVLEGFGRSFIPRIVYAFGFLQLSSLALGQLFIEEKNLECQETIVSKTLAMLSAWSPTVIILSGKQGPMVALAVIIGGYCIMRLENVDDGSSGSSARTLNFCSVPVMQWSLLAACLFFCTGHWCAFDGLRYSAAFIGFDDFVLIRQAILLTIETFGFSHLLPIFGLPFLVTHSNLLGQTDQKEQLLFLQLSQVYLMYGVIVATLVMFTMICVSLHRRHLMVWGLFAPKFVFDVVGLILADALILLASLYYFW